MVFALVIAAGIVAAAEDPSKREEPFHYDPKGRRDPFVALVRDGRLIGGNTSNEPIEPSKPVLYGILWDAGGESIALINDGEVKVGDTIGEYRVAEIRQDAVVLTSGAETLVLQLQFEKSAELSPNTTTGGEGP